MKKRMGVLALAAHLAVGSVDAAATNGEGAAGPARSEIETVVEAPVPSAAEAAALSPQDRKAWIVAQKLAMARAAAEAADAAGTREVSAEEIAENQRGREESPEAKLARRAARKPATFPGANGIAGLPGMPSTEALLLEAAQAARAEAMRGARPGAEGRGVTNDGRSGAEGRAAAATTGSSASAARARIAPGSTLPGTSGLDGPSGSHGPAARLLQSQAPSEGGWVEIPGDAGDEETLPMECPEWGASPETLADSPYCEAIGFLTDDTCHYARGTTMILHVFVNHGANTWSGEDRGAQIAKANQAKDWYRDQAPNNAYIRFDHEDTGQGYYVMCNLEDALPDPGSHAWVDDACAALGFTDDDGDGFISDDLTVWYQDQNGGWDNVIAVFQPANTFFQATASMERGACKIPPNATWQTWAHEWGHCFGAADEYGSCNGMGCGDIAGSCYLTDDVENGNCESDPCGGGSISCMMKFNSAGVPPCSFTERHWGWVDDDGDGRLDATLWNDAGTAQTLHELFHNGWFIHTNTDWGMVANQRWESWSVIGVRARDTAAYDLRVYADNNYRYHEASSLGHSAGYVNYVVGDFNRNNLGQDFVELTKHSGNGQYVLAYESGTGMLFPDGVDRAQSWEDYNVVRAFDVPLFGGETITFDLDILTPGLDLGMALYKSNPGGGSTPYYRGRTSGAEVAEADDWGNGISEDFTFTVPQDDVYGLIVWSNNEVEGDWEIKIGPTPLALAESAPHTSFLDLRLYNYAPSSGSWAVAAVRPEAPVNVSMSLFAESTYQTELASSQHYAGIEFVAVDYTGGASADYLRIDRVSGAGSFTTEWEQGDEILAGLELETWESGQITEVWDTYLEAGTTYFFRLYGVLHPYVDADLFLMSSVGGDNSVQRILRVAESASHNGQTGEWFSWTPAVTDWYGLVLVAVDDAGGNDALYALGMGPRVSLAENVAVSRPDELVWGDFAVPDGTWSVVGLRPEPGSTGQLGLWQCDSYAQSCYLQSDLDTGDVSFLAIDGSGLAATTVFPRFDRRTGNGVLHGSYDVANASLVWDGATVPAPIEASWTANEVVQAANLHVRVPAEVLYIEVRPLDADLDLGVALVQNPGGDPVLASYDVLARENDGGAGVSERIKLSAPPTGPYGIVVTNENGAAGAYEIHVYDDETTDVSGSEGPARLDFSLAGANPWTEEAAFALALPAREHVSVEVFDVTGRLVRSLAERTMESGVHTLRWDGRDDLGHGVAAGVYLARLDTGAERKVVKVVRAE